MLDPNYSQAILSALTSQEPLTIEYTDDLGAHSERSILLHKLYSRDGEALITATDLDKSEVRTFRLLRVRVVQTVTVRQVTYWNGSGEQQSILP